MREGILYPQGTLFRRYVQYTGVGSHSTSSHTGQSQGLNSGRVELEAYAFLLYGHSNIFTFCLGFNREKYNDMEIRPYKEMTEDEFSSSTYTKELIFENNKCKVFWGHANFGQVASSSCIWAKTNEETSYHCYIVETPIYIDSEDDKQSLRESAEQLINIL